MQEERSKILAQVPLYVSPYINLPKTPTLPHNYTSIPSTLPPSILSTNAAQSTSLTSQASSQPDPPAYVTSPQSTFAAHPSSIIAQNRALLDKLHNTPGEAKTKVAAWNKAIDDRELQEKRRRAPGWLDSDAKILNPEKTALVAEREQDNALAIGQHGSSAQSVGNDTVQPARQEGGELGDLMDRAFGGL